MLRLRILTALDFLSSLAEIFLAEKRYAWIMVQAILKKNLMAVHA
jgi:hypothetical protein